MKTFLAFLLVLSWSSIRAARADDLVNLVDLAGVRLEVRGPGGGVYSVSGYVGGTGDPETELTGQTREENAHLAQAVRSDAEAALAARGVPLLGARQPFTPPETRPVLEVNLSRARTWRRLCGSAHSAT